MFVSCDFVVIFLVKMVNVEKCFKIVCSNPKNINTFAQKIGPWFKEMTLLKFFNIGTQRPGSQSHAAGIFISHIKDKKAKTIKNHRLSAPLLEYSI